MPPIGSKRPQKTSNQQDSITVTQTSTFSQKEANERYFESKGFENMNRPDNVPPSQGGKYTGFGSTCNLPLM
jgi:ADP-ribosylation factor GTPase-activating protein 1